MSVPHWLLGAADSDDWPTRLDAMLHCWLAGRACTVATKTLRTDQDLLRLIPVAYLARDPRAITVDDLEAILDQLRSRGLSELSVRRHRASLSQFFAWLRRIGVASAAPAALPIAPAAEPSDPVVARPFSAAELDQAWQAWSAQDSTLADVMLVLARTGLRWSEARALQVGDFTADCGAMRVDKAASEGTVTRALPADRIRQVPVVDQVAGIVGRLADGRRSDELLFTTNRGCQLHRTAVLRRLDWQHTGQGRRLHDLRHTAAHLWLVEGIDPDTVQEWMGHTLLVTEARTA